MPNLQKLTKFYTYLEERNGINQNLKNVKIWITANLILIKDFEDRTERRFIDMRDNHATYIEIFDDKSTSTSTSKIFTGDFVKTNKNIVSFSFTHLDGKKIVVPVVFNLLLTKHKNILYLLNFATKERWIENQSTINTK